MLKITFTCSDLHKFNQITAMGYLELKCSGFNPSICKTTTGSNIMALSGQLDIPVETG